MNTAHFWKEALTAYSQEQPEAVLELRQTFSRFIGRQRSIEIDEMAYVLHNNNIGFFNVALSLLGLSIMAGGNVEDVQGAYADHYTSYPAARSLIPVLLEREKGLKTKNRNVLDSPEQVLDRLVFALKPFKSKTGKELSFFFYLLQGGRGDDNPKEGTAFQKFSLGQMRKCPAEVLTNRLFMSLHNILSKMTHQQCQELFARWQRV